MFDSLNGEHAQPKVWCHNKGNRVADSHVTGLSWCPLSIHLSHVTCDDETTSWHDHVIVSLRDYCLLYVDGKL